MHYVLRKMVNSKKTTVFLFLFALMNVGFLSFAYQTKSEADVQTIPWYRTEVLSRGVRSVIVPGTRMADINGYPRDRKPDVGCYEYRAETCNEDLQQRIFPNIGITDPNENFGGDLNWDGVVNYDDYWILGSWWVNFDESLDPNTILPYPHEDNEPPVIWGI